MTMAWLDQDFLLHSKSARKWYHDVAAPLPIIDYHSHLPPEVIFHNQPFSSLYDVWLAGDHYKWRAMRAAGVPESHCTGTASPREKFLAWAGTVPQTLRNPLYHWTHLELKRYFDIDELLGPDTAEQIWDRCNQMLKDEALLPRSILRRFGVQVLCTTDDPADDLIYHRQLAQQPDANFRMYPTYRPDNAFAVDQPRRWNQWLDRLEARTEVVIDSLDGLLEALRRRHDDFHDLGCRLSDHGLNHCFDVRGSTSEAKSVFQRARVAGQTTSWAEVEPEQADRFGGYLMRQLAEWDQEKGWTKQLHLGARRNNNRRLFQTAGPDIGCDSIGDWRQVDRLVEFLDDLDQREQLPRLIVYNLNPADNYAIATALGNFQDGRVAGKLQWGSGWWFLDQKEGMQWQLNALSQLGLLSRFIGMLTDSRSLLSFPRHEYFRRIFCNLIGQDIQAGELPDQEDLLRPLVAGVCYENARDSLGLELPPPAPEFSS